MKAVLRVPLDRGAEGVAVVADGYWPAMQGRGALKLQWDTAAVEKVDRERQLVQYRELASQPGPRHFDADMAPLAKAPRQLEAEFVFPYLAPAPMETLNCTVSFADDRAELWVGRQMPGLDGAAAAGVCQRPRAADRQAAASAALRPRVSSRGRGTRRESQRLRECASA